MGRKSENNSPSREHVGKMFDKIAGRYDLLNRLLSLRMDVGWRRKMVDYLPDQHGISILDLATGTADVPITFSKSGKSIEKIVGIDLSRGMLEIGREKIHALNLDHIISLHEGDAMDTGLESESFDTVSIAFGIRNVKNVGTALREITRVLKPGGNLIILEFSLPVNPFFRTTYLFYFRHILPVVGKLVSGDNSAYKYLNRTVETFPHGQEMCNILESNGFTDTSCTPLTLGIASIYNGTKG